MYRSISVTALASFIALGTQSAFAETTTPEAAPIVATTAGDATPQTARRDTSTISASAAGAVRARHAVRIPGTFAISSNETSAERNAREEQFMLRVLQPALSGDGGG